MSSNSNTVHLTMESFIDFCNKARLDKNAAAKFFGITLPEDKPREYTLGLNVYEDRIKLSLLSDGAELLWAYSYRKSDDFMGLMQAISYAAHQLYKKAQQDYLDGVER